MCYVEPVPLLGQQEGTPCVALTMRWEQKLRCMAPCACAPHAAAHTLKHSAPAASPPPAPPVDVLPCDDLQRAARVCARAAGQQFMSAAAAAEQQRGLAHKAGHSAQHAAHATAPRVPPHLARPCLARPSPRAAWSPTLRGARTRASGRHRAAARTVERAAAHARARRAHARTFVRPDTTYVAAKLPLPFRLSATADSTLRVRGGGHAGRSRARTRS